MNREYRHESVEQKFVLDNQKRVQATIDNDANLKGNPFSDVVAFCDYLTKRKIVAGPDRLKKKREDKFGQSDIGLREVKFDIEVQFADGTKTVEIVALANLFGKGYKQKKDYNEDIIYPIIYLEKIRIKE